MSRFAATSLLLFLVLLPGRLAAAQDYSNGYAYFALNRSCSQLNIAPQGVHLNVNVGEFYRQGVRCVPSTSGSASEGWPATGQIDLDAYSVFYMIPSPGYPIHFASHQSLGLTAQRLGTQIDSMEVRLVHGDGRYHALMKVRFEDQAEHTYTSALPNLTLGEAFSVRFYAWSSTVQPGGQAVGVVILNDITLPFSVDLRTGAEDPETPAAFRLAPAYPNPFNPQTRLLLSLDRPQPVRVEAYDLLGRRVRVLHDGVLPSGEHAVTFEADALPSGVYLIRATTAQTVVTRQVTLVR